MKKAIIDQMLLGMLLFVSLIVIGATVADNTQARDTYFNLQKVTDNAALSLGRYYNANIESADTQEEEDALKLEAQDIVNAMLDNTKLGIAAKKLITYEWQTDTDPMTVTASVENYIHDNFWYKFLDLTTFNLDARSMAEIDKGGEPPMASPDATPFGINGCGDNYADLATAMATGETLSFNIGGNSSYEDTNNDTFYGVDIGDACYDDGNSNWAHFKLAIKNFYVQNDTLKNDEPLLDIVLEDTQMCVPKVKKVAMEENVDPHQISQSIQSVERDSESEGGGLIGVQADLILFGCVDDEYQDDSEGDHLNVIQFIKVEFQNNPSETYSSQPGMDQFVFDLKIISMETDGEVKLINLPETKNN